jgi:hypothetical protein
VDVLGRKHDQIVSRRLPRVIGERGSRDMRLFIIISVAARISIAMDAHAQGGGEIRPPKPAIVEKLRAEAAKVGGAKLSPLFAALADPKNAKEVLLSPGQADLARRLEDLSRDVIKAWLLRDLDADPSPTPAVLSQRLSESGTQHRRRLVLQAEAIAFEGIFNPEQARILRKLTHQQPSAMLTGRHGPPVIGADDDERSIAELVHNLRNLSSTRSDSGAVSLALLGKPGMREWYPNGIAHLDPVHQMLARRGMPKADLTDEQIALERRLDKLILDIWNAWATRDVDRVPLPPRHVLAWRLWEGGERLRESLFSRAEMIALQGIVTPQQADQALTAVWEQYGMSALLDPTLAARLRLTRSQREEIFSLLESKKDVSRRMSEAVQPFWGLRLTNPAAQREIDLLMQDSDSRQEEVDELILSQVLSSSQARSLVRILNRPNQPVRRPAGKAKKPGRPG